MGVAGFFLLISVIVAVASMGGGIYAVAARRCQEQLSPNATDEGDESHPEHVEVDGGQRACFVDGR